MGLIGAIGRLLNFNRSENNGTNFSQAVVDRGAGVSSTVEYFQPVGDDSHPLPGDYVILIPVRRQGGYSAVSYIDPKNEQVAAAGEKRIYARNAAGDAVCIVWLKNDGSVHITNENGSFVMQANGDVVINGVIIKANGDIDAPGRIDADGNIETPNIVKGFNVISTETNNTLGAHVHPSNGSPPIPGT